MNFALGTIISLVLVSPGVFFRMGFLSNPNPVSTVNGPLVNEIFYSLIPAIILQLVGLALLNELGRTIDFVTIIEIITSRKESTKLSNKIVSTRLPAFFFYHILLSIFGWATGRLIRYAIDYFGLFRTSSVFKLNNEWYYLLTGAMVLSRDEQKIAYVQVDALAEEVNGKAIIYSGILSNYKLSRNGDLEHIILTNVYRREFEDDLVEGPNNIEKEIDDRYYNMPGEIFIIPYQKIQNLNITYLLLVQEE